MAVAASGPAPSPGAAVAASRGAPCDGETLNTSRIVTSEALDASRIVEEWRRTWAGLQESLDSHRMAQERLLAKLAPAAPIAAPPSSNAPEKQGGVSSVGQATIDISPVILAPAGDDCMAVHDSDNPSMMGQGSKTSARSKKGSDEPAGEVISAELDTLRELTTASSRRTSVKEEVKFHVANLLTWWLELREPKRSGLLARWVKSGKWEVLVALVIALNAMFMGYSADWAMRNTSEVSDEMFVVECIFLAFFIFEISIRISVHRLYFFCNDEYGWNIFDFFIVALSLYDTISAIVFSRGSDGNVTFMRSMRLLRLARMLRVLRIFKFAMALRRMLQSVLGSFVELFWSFALLCFVFYLFSIATVQGVTSFLISPESESMSDKLESELEKYFGSVLVTMFTYYMATSGGGDWSVYYYILRETGGITAGLFLFVIVFTQIALLNIMTGVFVESAMKLAQPDRNTLALEQRKANMKDVVDLREIMRKLDADCTGSVSWEEFSVVCSDPKVSSVLEVMGLDIKDASVLFEMLSQASNKKEVDFDFLVDACMRMKGPATSLDLQALTYKTDLLYERLEELANQFGKITAA